MTATILRALLPCRHRNTTWPLTKKGVRLGTYVVCLDCGCRLAYDWSRMRIGKPERPHRAGSVEPGMERCV